MVDYLGNLTYGYWGYSLGIKGTILCAGSQFAGMTGDSPDTFEDIAYVLHGIMLYCEDADVEFSMI